MRNGADTEPEPAGFSGGALLKASFDARVGNHDLMEVGFRSTVRDAPGEVSDYLWDFGDGLPATEPDPVHVYPRAGTYTVTLLVWDEEGRAAHVERVLRVRSPH